MSKHGIRTKIVFELTPVPPEIRDLAVEAFALWQRWHVAVLAKTAPEGSSDEPPVLPEDRARYIELQRQLQPYYRIDPQRRVVARGQFEGQSPPGRPMSGLTVRWLQLTS